MANTPAGANTVLTPHAVNAPAGASKPSSRHPLRTTRSQLQFIVRDILYNFFKFNVHSRLQGGLLAQQALTPVKGILRMPQLHNLGAGWVSTVLCSIAK
jgi:hypothetical protein